MLSGSSLLSLMNRIVLFIVGFTNSLLLQKMKHFIIFFTLALLSAVAAAQERESISPLLATRWGQGAPFNSKLSPLSNGKMPQVGCNATAAAQVIRYHKHAKGNYNFSLMPDNPSEGHYTSEEAEEIGKLMRDLGTAMNMKYGEFESTSGVTSPGQALANAFGYDRSISIKRREYFSDEEWENMIYEELKAGRPVIYAGQRSSGGLHCFVIHGYDSEKNLFAINWGWGGYCDGYFPLTGNGALVSGAYGSEGYTEDQMAYFNVRPDEGGSEVTSVGTRDKYLLNSLANNSHYDNINVKLTGDKKELFVKAAFYNTSLSNISNMACGVMLREKTTKKTYYSGTIKTLTIDSGKYQTSRITLAFDASIVAYNGVYEVLPVVRKGSKWIEVSIPATQKPATITCTGGKDDPTSGISMTTADESSLNVNEILNITSPDGKIMPAMSKGMNIIRMKDGSVRKVFLLKKQ